MGRLNVIKFPVEDELNELRRLFRSSLEASNPLLKSVFDYILSRNGKMMRPTLTLLVAKEHGAVSPSTFRVAVTVEMLHTASLIHDDVVDESNQRRGQSSVNALYDNKVSVLVGDYLLSTALQHAALTSDNRVVEIISQVGRELSDGEMLQLSNIDDNTLSEGVYFEIIRKKTATLFAACAQLGALTAKASGQDVERFRLFGEKLGICFQIKDDIFDYYPSEEIGKPSGHDLTEGKITLPLLYALLHTDDKAMQALVPKVKHGSATPEERGKLIDFAKMNGGIAYAEEVMVRYKEDALLLLAEVQNEAVRNALAAYLEYVVERNK